MRADDDARLDARGSGRRHQLLRQRELVDPAERELRRGGLGDEPDCAVDRAASATQLRELLKERAADDLDGGPARPPDSGDLVAHALVEDPHRTRDGPLTTVTKTLFVRPPHVAEGDGTKAYPAGGANQPLLQEAREAGGAHHDVPLAPGQ